MQLLLDRAIFPLGMPLLEYVLKGLKKKEAGKQTRTKCPINIMELKQLKEV